MVVEAAPKVVASPEPAKTAAVEEEEEIELDIGKYMDEMDFDLDNLGSLESLDDLVAASEGKAPTSKQKATKNEDMFADEFEFEAGEGEMTVPGMRTSNDVEIDDLDALDLGLDKVLGGLDLLESETDIRGAEKTIKSSMAGFAAKRLNDE